MSRNAVVVSYCVLIIIRQLKSLKFRDKENYFETLAAAFICFPYLLEKDANVSNKFTSRNFIESR